MRYLCLIVLILITGCAPLVEETPPINIPGSYRNAPRSTEAPRVSSRWWKDFNDPVLDRLVDETLRNNHDIRLAAERVLEARADLGVSRAGLFPTVNLQADITRQRQSYPGPQGITSSSTTATTISPAAVASYELDLWGKLSSSERASFQRLVSSEENRRTVIQTVVADLASLYFEMIGLQRKIGLLHTRIENNKKTLEIIKRRYRRGLSSYLDLLQARSRLSETEARLPVLERQARDLSQRISIIAGRYPGYIKTDPARDYISKLKPVAVGLPSELLLRRPDLREKEAQMDALFEELKAARARRFPQISLTGSYGWVSDELRGLFRPESLLWRLSAGVLQPLFDAGKLRSSEEAALSRYRQRVIAYAKTVLQAFYEVESALMKRQRLREERGHLLELLKEVQRTYRVSLSRYQRGLVDLLRVLELERQLFQARERLIDVETAILTNRVFLYRALGGTWEEG